MNYNSIGGSTIVGMIVQVGGPTNYTKYKVKVRIPLFNGPNSIDDLPEEYRNKKGYYTKDEDLPWIPVMLNYSGSASDNPVDLSDKFTVGELVYIQYTGKGLSGPVVVGTTGRLAYNHPNEVEGSAWTSTGVQGNVPSINNKSDLMVDTLIGKLSVPVDPSQCVISSPYGNRSGGFHYGTDLAGYTSLGFTIPIYAISDGEVIDCVGKYTDNSGNANKASNSSMDSYGNYITLKHSGSSTIYSRYAHMYTILVTSGDTVSAGQQIGIMGSTGNSTGMHLHFEVLNGGTTASLYGADPMNYYPGVYSSM